ncbi:T cell receptor gamma, constant 4 [Apodemus speciosus]
MECRLGLLDLEHSIEPGLEGTSARLQNIPGHSSAPVKIRVPKSLIILKIKRGLMFFVEVLNNVTRHIMVQDIFQRDKAHSNSSRNKRIDSDISPKPTIFLPSVAEINLHKGGTYLCLLENFFPDIIRVYWIEKNGGKILESQEGNTMKTNDRYMKLCWLTVTEDKMDKEHSCIVKHEKNKRGDDQEILFPPISKGMDCQHHYSHRSCFEDRE